jgi:hypothetical protein
MPFTEKFIDWCANHADVSPPVRTRWDPLTIVAQTKLMLHLEALPVGVAAGRLINPDFKIALDKVKKHVFIATDREMSYWGLSGYPNFIANHGRDIVIDGITVKNENSATSLMNGVSTVKEKLSDTPWILCGGSTGKGDVAVGIGQTHWIVTVKPENAVDWAGMSIVTTRQELVELLALLAEKAWAIRDDE